MKSKATTRPTQFAVCTDNKGYPASLEVGKLYSVIPDAAAEQLGYIRVVDESGEDYGYSAERFFPLEIPDLPEEGFERAQNAFGVDQTDGSAVSPRLGRGKGNASHHASERHEARGVICSQHVAVL